MTVLFPDAVAAILTHIHTALDVPTDYRPTPGRTAGPLVVARRAGGTSADRVIDRATLVIEAWEDTYGEAEALAQQVRAELLAITNQRIDDTLIYRVVELGAFGWDPDPVSGSPRFTGTYAPDVRGVSVPA